MKKNTKGLVFIGLYVDDNLFIGHPTAINDLIGKLRNHGLILKVEDNLKDYLSCKINFSCNMKQSWLGQLHLISNIARYSYLKYNMGRSSFDVQERCLVELAKVPKEI